ncbi:MAG: helix-turn-helix domain-containing protein [Kiritimatiellae bacterium]|nr:helix-turn-helix domain-containing protein [Kiritimatiellia bacterium]
MKKQHEEEVFRIALDRLSAIGARVTEGALLHAEAAPCRRMVETAVGSDKASIFSKGCLGLCGIFGRDEVLDALRTAHFPTLNLSNNRGSVEGLGNFISDDREVGRMAAEHLLKRGYRFFLLVGETKKVYSEDRIDAFRDRVAQEPGTRCAQLIHDFQSEFGSMSMPAFVLHCEELLSPLFEDAPMDAAVFATNDWLAGLMQRVIMAHYTERMYTTAVLGVDDEQHTWWYLGPLAGLSSVRPAFHQMGKEAMAWLMAHEGDREAMLEEPTRRFAPEGVIERASTAGGPCPDPMTARMIRWAWQASQSGQKVTVTELASQFRLSRRTLDRKFSEHLGTSAGDYLLRQRLDMAAHLLRTTDMSIAEISFQCGYTKQDTLSTRFRAVYGMTPKAYRKEKTWKSDVFLARPQP